MEIIRTLSVLRWHFFTEYCLINSFAHETFICLSVKPQTIKFEHLQNRVTYGNSYANSCIKILLLYGFVIICL